MPQRHAIDLADLDLEPAVRTAQAVTSRLVDLAKDATYIAVGFGVLAVNRAQTHRREFERALRG